MANRFLEGAARLAPLYSCLLDETKEAFPKFETDPWHSIGFFLYGYGFEHQGRAPDYRYAGADAIHQHCNSKLNANSAEMAWNSFRQKLNHRNLNCARNPLCPKGCSYSHLYRKQSRQSCVKKLSVIEFVFRDLAGNPLIRWTRELLESGNTQAAHSALKKINGVSDKIASLFLRDIATIHAITVGDNQKRFLQPIDMWLRFVVWKLQGRKLSDTQCAEFVVNNSTAPEKTNQGTWYFCTRVAGSSRYMVSRSIDDPRCYRKAMDLHLRQLSKSSEALPK